MERRQFMALMAAATAVPARKTGDRARSIGRRLRERRFIKGAQYVNDLNWTKGLNPETGKPLEYNPKLDVQIYNPVARAAA